MEVTLAYELQRLHKSSKKNNGLKKEDYENLILFFGSYYGGKAIGKKGSEILDAKIIDILKDSNDFIFNVIQGVKSYPNDKYKLSERLDILLVHLKKKYELNYSESIFDNFKIKDKNERLLMMLKYLHSGEKSRSDIAEDFGISERTVADHLLTLQDGFSFLGSEMKIQELERGTTKYRSLIHPVFLALNSSEIYSLTVGLKLLSKDTVFENTLGRIADAVFEQLSEDSKEMINKHKTDNVTFDNDEMKFINSLELARKHDSPFTYYLKEPIECVVTYDEDGNHVKYQGILRLTEASIGNIYNKVIIVNDEESIILKKDNVINIRRADEEKYFKNFADEF